MDEVTPPRKVSALLAAADGVAHGFYGNAGGVSVGVFASLNASPFAGDDPAAVAANRRRVADHLGAARLVTNRQVHGNRVRVVGGGLVTGDGDGVVDADADTTDGLVTGNADGVVGADGDGVVDADADGAFTGNAVEADGLVTAATGVAIGVLAADCAPVLLLDADARVVGAAHAGWRGGIKGVTDAVLDAMVGVGARRERIVAAVGPAIQAASYRVGGDFAKRFKKESPVECTEFFHRDGNGDLFFNLPGYIKKRIHRAGVTAVDTLADDTFTDQNFFSYRRNQHRGEQRYGRQLSAIVLR